MVNFRKRKKILPGVHLNISKSGISTTLGPKGANINIGKRGVFLNTGIPGTGIYSRKKININSNNKNDDSKYFFLVDGKFVDVRLQEKVEFTDQKGVFHTLTGQEYGYYIETGLLPHEKQIPTQNPKKTNGCLKAFVIVFAIFGFLFFLLILAAFLLN